MKCLEALAATARTSHALRSVAADRAVAPLRQIVGELIEVGVETSLVLNESVYGDGSISGTMTILAFHEPDLKGTAVYDLDINTSLGTILISTHVLTPDEDPEADELGEQPRPVREVECRSLEGGYGKWSIDDVVRLVERAFVARSTAAPGSWP